MKLRRTMVVVVIGLSLVLLGSTFLSAQMMDRAQFSVVPRSHSYLGLTYGEWANKWQQWATLLPANSNPLLDTTDCSTGQSGPVWFLGGTFCTAYNPNCSYTNVRRSCTIPAQKALFFPVLNTEYSYLENPAGSTEADIRLATKQAMDGVLTLSATVDGVPIHNLKSFRICTSGTTCDATQAPLFSYTLASHDNLYAAIGETENAVSGGPLIKDGASTEGVTDGWYIMLEPLSPGHHTLTFHGEMTGFALDVGYQITVLK